MDHPKKSNPPMADAGNDDEEIIELTEVMEIKPRGTSALEAIPEDLNSDGDYDVSDDAVTAELEPEVLPETEYFELPHEDDEIMEVDEIDDLDNDMEDLDTLVSDITGSTDPASRTTRVPVPALGEIPMAHLDMAVEKAVEKIFKEKIEAKIMALFEAVVKKEIDKLTALIQEEVESEEE